MGESFMKGNSGISTGLAAVFHRGLLSDFQRHRYGAARQAGKEAEFTGEEGGNGCIGST